MHLRHVRRWGAVKSLPHGSVNIAPGPKNCNVQSTKRSPAWPHWVGLGVLLVMATRLAKSRPGCWILPAFLGLGGCSGGVAAEEGGPWGSASAESGATPGSTAEDAESETTATPANAPTGSADAPTSANDGVQPPPPGVTPPPAQNPAIAPTTFACDPSAVIASVPLRRLSQKQYENSVRDVVARLLGSTPGDAEVDAFFAELPADDRLKLPQDLHGTYRRLDQRVQQPHVDAWFAAGVNVGKWLSSSERLGTVLGDCEQFDDSRACVRDFIARLGRVAFRRPLETDEVDFYYGFYEPSTGIDGAGVADVIAGILNAPDFLYLVEGRGASDDDAPNQTLTAHELAARLSYHFWNTLPDVQLSDLADSGELLDPEVYQAQVERLFGDARTTDAVADFYGEWLKIEDLSALDRNNDSSLFQAFAGDNLPSGQLAEAMRAEVHALLHYYTFEQPDGVLAVLNTPYSFATSSELAGLYGAEAWDGLGTPPNVGAERPGLLTRAAFLATGTANTRPIMRGLFVRTNILCDTIAPPPAEAGATPPELSPNLTTREVVEELTEPSACSGCHNAFINPLGFAFEGFDSLGRVRTQQRLFDDDGNEIATKPIDTSSMPQVVLGDASLSQGPSDLMRLLAESGKVEACLARQYFRFTFGRWEQISTDGCALEQMRVAAGSGGSLAAMLREVALSAAFRTRTVPADPTTGAEP